MSEPTLSSEALQKQSDDALGVLSGHDNNLLCRNNRTGKITKSRFLDIPRRSLFLAKSDAFGGFRTAASRGAGFSAAPTGSTEGNTPPTPLTLSSLMNIMISIVYGALIDRERRYKEPLSSGEALILCEKI
jgi:hypothetical protein